VNSNMARLLKKALGHILMPMAKIGNKFKSD
jgi:hypothetical protein